MSNEDTTTPWVLLLIANRVCPNLCDDETLEEIVWYLIAYQERPWSADWILAVAELGDVLSQ